MSLTAILVILGILGAATLMAKFPFGLVKPSWVLVISGIIGSIMVVFGIEVEPEPLDGVRWMALIGTTLSFVALLGLLALILIWVIRRWGIRHSDNPWNQP